MFSLSENSLACRDFSPRSLGAARYAEALADRYGAQVTMLHAIPPPQYDIELMEAAAIPLTEMSASRKAADRGAEPDVPQPGIAGVPGRCHAGCSKEIPRGRSCRSLITRDST